MEKFGLERGVSKELTKAQHTELREFYADQNQKVERLKAYERTFGKETEWDIDTYIEFVKNKGEREQSQERSGAYAPSLSRLGGIADDSTLMP